MEIEYKQWYEVIGLATKQQWMWSVYVSNNLDWDKDHEKIIWDFVVA